MRRAGLFILAFVAAALASAGPEIAEDPPVVAPPKSGDLTGTIAPGEQVAKVSVVCRATGKEHKADAFDAKTGRFAVNNLPGDAAYDVCIVTTDGARIEGIDLSWHEARMLRLAALRRQQLKLPAEKPRPFTREDADELLKYPKDLKDFTDLRRVLYLAGDPAAPGRATMLVEAMRTSDFYAQKSDELIWRVELWYFEFRHGGWERVANVERVLVRQRIPAQQWRKITLVYYPELSARLDAQGKSPPVSFRIPDNLDGARGRLAGTEPVQNTQPVILGLSAGTTTSSAPAHE